MKLTESNKQLLDLLDTMDREEQKQEELTKILEKTAAIQRLEQFSDLLDELGDLHGRQ